jgi:hypothetical protein
LKEIATYGITYNTDLLSAYSDGDTRSMANLNGMIEINEKIEKEIEDRQIFKQQQKGYYEVLLQNIYLPSLNVWKDPYTKNFNM